MARIAHIDPEIEARRIAALKKLQILDTPPETNLDDIALLAAQICGTPSAVVSLIDETRQWYKARVGVSASEVPREISFCQHVIARDETMVIEDARLDERFATNPFVTGGLKVRFYAGVPLRSNGSNVGTLCVIDPETRVLRPEQRAALQSLARQVEAQLDLRLRLREVSELAAEVTRQRDQIAAVQKQNQELVALVVHDLKSPLSSILAESTVFLDKASPDADATQTLHSISAAARRMHRMTLEMLDVIQGSDGELRVDKRRVVLDDIIARARKNVLPRAEQQLVQVLLIGGGERTQLQADANVLERVIENLLDNAIKYGRDGKRIEIESHVTNSAVEVRISDLGRGVPADEAKLIFDKNYRAVADRADTKSNSHGLGLTFCRLAIEAHGGTIWVEPNKPHGARFCFRIPLGRDRRSAPGS